MSVVSDQKQQDQKHPDIDPFVEQLAQVANRAHVGIGVTLFVGGAVISGRTIAGRAYFERLAAQAQEADTNMPSVLDIFTEGLNQWASVYPAEPVVEATTGEIAPLRFIHLEDVRLWTSATMFERSEMRLRLSAIEGFSFGQLK